MSEYQYYEFQAIDRPLDEREMAELRAISTRATITATSFTNTYHWGDLKADPWQLLGKYFDAFLYVANWGSHWLGFRVPTDAIDLGELQAYKTSESFTISRRKRHTVLRLCSDVEPDGWEEGEGWLARLVSLRADILRGDLRAPYLAWLADVQHDIVEQDCEPPLPAGLGDLSAPLKSLADFLRLDEDLVRAAADASDGMPEQTPDSQEALDAWVRSLAEAEKDALLCRVARGDGHVQWELQAQFRKSCQRRDPRLAADASSRRSINALLDARDEYVKQRQQRQAAERARTQREAAARRKAYLEDLAGRQDAIRAEIGELVETRQQNGYDRAVGLLIDLRDVASLAGNSEALGQYVTELRQRHARKTSFLRRLEQAGL